jgi:hypothetical protein
MDYSAYDGYGLLDIAPLLENKIEGKSKAGTGNGGHVEPGHFNKPGFPPGYIHIISYNSGTNLRDWGSDFIYSAALESSREL